MELTTKEKKENAALNRTEMSFDISFDKAMPGRKQAREAICAATGVAPELLVIVSMQGGFGTNRAVVLAHAYKDKSALSMAGKHLLVRDGMAEKEKKAAKAAPAKK